MTKTPEELLELVVKTADARRAKDIMAINMQNISVMSDYNVIMHASNSRLINAIAEAVVDEAQKTGMDSNKINVEGKQAGAWVLIDLGAVIVHVFDEDERSHYNLEGLWTDGELVDVSEWVTEE